MSKGKEKEVTKDMKRQPWIQKNKGFRIIIAVSLSLALWVGYQIIKIEGNWGKGILVGVIFGASIPAIYYGMNFFHDTFKKDKRD